MTTIETIVMLLAGAGLGCVFAVWLDMWRRGKRPDAAPPVQVPPPPSVLSHPVGVGAPRPGCGCDLCLAAAVARQTGRQPMVVAGPLPPQVLQVLQNAVVRACNGTGPDGCVLTQDAITERGVGGATVLVVPRGVYERVVRPQLLAAFPDQKW